MQIKMISFQVWATVPKNSSESKAFRAKYLADIRSRKGTMARMVSPIVAMDGLKLTLFQRKMTFVVVD